MLDAGSPELDVVPRIRFFYSGMMRHPQAGLVRLVLERLHHVAINSQDLDPIHAHRLELPNARARLLRVARRGTLVEHRIDEKARAGDFALGALRPQLQSLRRVAADVAGGR